MTRLHAHTMETHGIRPQELRDAHDIASGLRQWEWELSDGRRWVRVEVIGTPRATTDRTG